MKILVNLWEMNEFPSLVPCKPGEDDRRMIEVPDDLHERLVEACKEFCAVLSEVHVQCVEILDAPDPYPVRLEVGRTDDWDRTDAWIARCSRGGCRTVTTVRRKGWGGEDHARAIADVLALGWKERRHGGLACPEHASTEILLEGHQGAVDA